MNENAPRQTVPQADVDAPFAISWPELSRSRYVSPVSNPTDMPDTVNGARTLVPVPGLVTVIGETSLANRILSRLMGSGSTSPSANAVTGWPSRCRRSACTVGNWVTL